MEKGTREIAYLHINVGIEKSNKGLYRIIID